VFNTTFKTFSAISWWSVLLVEETVVPDLPQVTDKLYHIMLYQVHLALSRYTVMTDINIWSYNEKNKTKTQRNVCWTRLCANKHK
jgi:hypothetical protein